MPKVKIYDMLAKEAGEMELNDSVFAVEYNEPLIHEAVVAHLANRRQGTKSTLTRTEVRGHAKKPWRQKHTGRARHGDTKAPQFIGGGVVFAPKPRDFSKKMNKQAKAQAFASALSQKLAQGELTIVNKFELANAKTKEVNEFVKAFKFPSSVVVVTANKDESALRACRNLEKVSVNTADLIRTYDIVANKNIVMTEEAVKFIQEAYAN